MTIKNGSVRWDDDANSGYFMAQIMKLFRMFFCSLFDGVI